jgi:RNA 2',3'-cyclic 3'-phosphodiesterase
VSDVVVPTAETPDEPRTPAEPIPPLRLFVGVNLQITIARRVADAVFKLRSALKQKARIAWVPAANLHLTLKYLGHARPEIVPGIREALNGVAAGQRGFDVTVRGYGGFPGLQDARVLWVGVEDPSGGLTALARAVEQRLVGLGFAADPRPFHPHVTIGRVRQGFTPDLAAHFPADVHFGNSQIRDVVLYESRVKSAGSEYVSRARAVLAAPERQTRSVEETGTRSEELEAAHGREPT